jgi:hypothetical protein
VAADSEKSADAQTFCGHAQPENLLLIKENKRSVTTHASAAV